MRNGAQLGTQTNQTVGPSGPPESAPRGVTPPRVEMENRSKVPIREVAFSILVRGGKEMKSCFLCWTCEVSCHDTLGKTASAVSPDGAKRES